MPHKILVRNGFDLQLEVNIPYTLALLGGKIQIPTLNGMYDLEIKECTNSGTVMRLKNKGIKMLNRDAYGDLLVTIKTEPPKNLDKKTKELLKQIAENNSINNYPKYKNYLDKIK